MARWTAFVKPALWLVAFCVLCWLMFKYDIRFSRRRGPTREQRASRAAGEAQSRARDARDAGRLPEAVRHMDEAVEAEPKDPNNWQIRGKLKLEAGDAAGAAADATQAMALAADPSIPQGLRARARLTQGDTQGAIADADAVLERHPHDPVALEIRGLARFRTDDLTGARDDFDAALRGDEKLEEAAPTLALIHLRAGRLEDARAAQKQIAPSDFRGRTLFTRILLAEGKFEDALFQAENFKFWPAAKPVEVRFLYGRALLRTGKLPAAKTELRGFLDEAAPDHPDRADAEADLRSMEDPLPAEAK